MTMETRFTWATARSAIIAALVVWVLASAASESKLEPKAVSIGRGIVLNYVEQGSGTPVIFVHGSLSDYTYWQSQLGPFAEHYRAIAYSRRYNFPNRNPARAGYSAITDAEDLAGLIRALHLEKPFIVGHSYGALTALFLAAHEPNLVRGLVLAEAPAMSLLEHVEGSDAARSEAMYLDIGKNMVAPMRKAFSEHDTERGVATFIDYVFASPQAWSDMPEAAKQETLRDAHEWEVMLPNGTLFPAIETQAVRGIHVPVLLLSGARSYPFLGLIDTELTHLLPSNQRIIFADAGHQMWLQHPEECRADALAFFDSVLSARHRRISIKSL